MSRSPPNVRVFLADDEPLIRHRVVEVLAARGVSVVGQAETQPEAVYGSVPRKLRASSFPTAGRCQEVSSRESQRNCSGRSKPNPGRPAHRPRAGATWPPASCRDFIQSEPVRPSAEGQTNCAAGQKNQLNQASVTFVNNYCPRVLWTGGFALTSQEPVR
jgi:hypothetical protein